MHPYTQILSHTDKHTLYQSDQSHPASSKVSEFKTIAPLSQMISRTDPSYFPTMTSPIRSCAGAITNLFTIPQKQEGREGNRWEGRRMASRGHNAHCSLPPPPPHPLSLRLPALLGSARSLAVRGARGSGGSQSV